MKLHPVVMEDLLGAGALENWPQVCAEPSEIFCDKVHSPLIVISKRVPCFHSPLSGGGRGETGADVEK